MMFASQLMTADRPERLWAESSRAYMFLLQAAYQGLPEIDPTEYRLGGIELFGWSFVHGAMMLWLDELGPDVDQQAFLTLTEGILELKMRQ